MNRIYRIVFNRSTGTCQAVSETASSHGGAGSSAGTSTAVPSLSRLATACLLSMGALGVNPAAADGGSGGYSYFSGSSGGAGGNSSSTTADGQAGSASRNSFYGGGGGGGGGVSISGATAGYGGAGGRGGAAFGSTNPVAAGGAGGALGATISTSTSLTNSAGGAGGAGTAQTLSGGGGGGGGGFGAAVLNPGTFSNASTISGGVGGTGGNGNNYGGGGGGGQGGGGLLLTTAVTSLQNTSAGVIKGGVGGRGGNDPLYYGPGQGGQGGAGVAVRGTGVVLTNQGTITGGAGGISGTSRFGQYISNGGAGVVGADLTIINSGTISGGSGSYGYLGNAIEFTAGTNKLELSAGSVINGGILANGASDTLKLVGNVDSTLAITGQFRGFEAFEKTGTATWTLTGQTGDLPTLALREGGLQIGDGLTYTNLQGKQGSYTSTVYDSQGNGTGVAGGNGQVLINVVGGSLSVKPNAEVHGGDGGAGSGSFASGTNALTTVVGGAGGAGATAVVLTQGTLNNAGIIAGGYGYDGGYANFYNSQPSPVNGVVATPLYVVTGGAGGNGGNGLETTIPGSVTNSGTIQGNAAGSGGGAYLFYTNATAPKLTGGAGGVGGNGIVTSSAATLTNAGTVYGGDGGYGGFAQEYGFNSTVSQAVITGGAGGAGGNAVVFTSVGALNNNNTLTAGSGGYGGTSYSYYSSANTLTGGSGGAGGVGALFTLGGTALNSGTITGGFGGGGGDTRSYTSSSSTDVVQGGVGGAGGQGIAMLDTGSVSNSGTVQGGQGGNGGNLYSQIYSSTGSSTAVAQGAASGAGGAGVFFAVNGTLGNSASGAIVGGQGSSGNVDGQAQTYSNGAPLAQSTVNSVASATGGAGVYVGGVASVTNDGAITGGLGGGNNFGGGGNRSTAFNYNGQAAIATAYGNAGGVGGAGAMLAGGGLATNNIGGTLQGGQGGTSAAYASASSYNAGASLTATAIGSQGGVGGAGADLAGGSKLVNAGNVNGGQGGDGGYASANASLYQRFNAGAVATPLAVTATGGNGGMGGAGMTGSNGTVTNLATGVIAGGNGGIAGSAAVSSSTTANGYSSAPGTSGTAGAGGVGITGTDLAVTNAGRVSGGLSGSNDQAAAIVFSGGVNSLTLESTSVIEGKVLAFSAADTLALGGATNGTFDVTTIAPNAQYSGFGQFGKTGASTWTLTGSNSTVTPWTVSAGTLAIASDASLGAISGALTLAGGTLQTTANVTTARAVTLTALGGTLLTDANTTLAISGAVTGSGALTKAGTGTLRLSGVNSYSGGTAITAGTLIGSGSSFGTGAIANNAALILDEAGSSTLANALSGSGTLAKTGAGTVRLSGVNSYSGGTAITAGTLIGSGTSFGTGAIVNNATLVLDEAGSSTMANTISGSGSLTKTGAGLVLYTGNGAAFTGATQVLGGTFSANGILGGLLTIASGATLKGRGTIGSTVLSSGATVAPGNSIGTLSVAGNFTFAPGSTYQAEVDAAGKSDLLRVSGTATLGGASVMVLAANGTYAPMTTYTILTSGNRVGTFGAVTSNFAFLNPTLTYDPANVFLTLTRNSINFQSVGSTANQSATGAALQSQGAGVLYDAVVQLSAVTAQSAFDQLSGEIHASAKTAMLEDSRFVREAGMDRVRQSQGGSSSGITAQEKGNGNTTWARVFGSKGQIDGNGNAARLNRDVAGFFAGADTMASNGWRAGGMVGYSKSNINVLNDSAKIDSYHVGVYGGNEWDNTALRLGAGYSWSRLDTNRTVAFMGFADSPRARYNASTAQIFGEIGQKMDAGSIALEPFAGLAYVKVDSKGFSESGGPAALHSGGGSTDSTFSTLGVRASTSLSESTKLRGMLGWRHAFSGTMPTNNNAFATGNSFTVSGVPLAKNVAVIEAGMETQLQNNMTLGVSYSGQLGNGLKDHGLKATLGWKF